MRLLGTALIIATLGTTPAPLAAETEPVRARYDVYFGGLHILSAESEFTPGLHGYSVIARSKTEGMLSVLWDWRGETRSQGRFVDGRAIPEVHKNFGLRGDEEKIVELTYDPEGEVRGVRVDPPLDTEEVTELPENAEVGTVDPLSVVAQISYAIGTQGLCAGEFAVFDGRRRYDLKVTDQGPAVLPETSYSIFSGEAKACGVEYSLLGGERREKSKYAKTARERVVYVAHPVPGGPAMPVALKIETDFGTLMAHLTELKGPQVQASN